MRKISFILGAAALCLGLASCNKSEMDIKDQTPAMQGPEISMVNGIITKGYVDGTKFYEKAVADLHSSTVTPTARQMYVSAYINPQEGEGRNYFVNEIFETNGLSGAAEKWVHTPALFWPLGGNLDFMCLSSTEPFAAKDAAWNELNASSGLVLLFDESRTQDDVLYAVASGKSGDSSSSSEGVYTTGKPVNVEFSHAQAWLEFQLSVADESMKDKIAITEIIVDGAYDKGKLKLTRNTTNTPHTVDAVWTVDGKAQFKFDDSYSVYGHLMAAEEYTDEQDAVDAAKEALKAAQNEGDADKIAYADSVLSAKQALLQAAYETYEVVNAINAVGSNEAGGEASAAAESETNCSYLDMLLPEQNKADFIIRYVLAGNPNVLEYRFRPKNSGSDKWEMGKKYIYDIDFVISEIAFNPTVKEYIASFDGDTNPIEIK